LTQSELLTFDACLREAERAGVPPAARAMAMARADEGRIDLEADPAAKATSTDGVGHCYLDGWSDAGDFYPDAILSNFGNAGSS
jgi:hypothetical protein